MLLGDGRAICACAHRETGVHRTLVGVPDPSAHPGTQLCKIWCCIGERVEEAKELPVLRSSAVAWDGHMGWCVGDVLCTEQATVR